jgi:DNA-binding transcriptional ArsR family regulator
MDSEIIGSQGLTERPGKIDRNKICRIRAYIRTYNARMRNRGQHGGPITHAHEKVFNAIVSFVNASNGACFPAIASIASRAGCAPSTVSEALKSLETAGVLARIRRTKWVIRRARGRTYRVPTRTSNSYLFLLPTLVQVLLEPLVKAVGSDSGRRLPRDHAGLAIFAARTRQAAPGPSLGRGCVSRLDALTSAFRARMGIKPITP